MKTEWNLELLFKNEKEIAKERKVVEEQTKAFVTKWEARDDYLKDPKVLKEALDEYNEWETHYGTAAKEYYYYQLQHELDLNNPEIKAKFNKVQEYAIKLGNDMQFFSIRVAKIDKKLQKKFLTDKALTPYKHYLEKSFEEADHILSEPEEKIINLTTPLTSNWSRMVSGFVAKEEREVLDDTGKKTVKNFSEISSLTSNTKKKVRDAAAKALNDIVLTHLDVAENELNAVLQHKKIMDDLRRYPRPDAARHMSDDIDTDVVDALVSVVTKRLSIAEDYYKLKAKLFGVKKLAYHERNVPYGKVDKKYTFEEAASLVEKVFAQLDPEFAMILQGYLQNGHLDVFPKKGKEGGAFCTHELITHPTYILMNFNGKLQEILTLAHEVGHGINSELMKTKQNALNFGTPKSTAEVASTFMEDFVLEELMKEADGELRLALMMMKLNDDMGTIFRQVTFYNFETDLHNLYREKGYLAKGQIGELFRKHAISSMGSAVEQTEGTQNWWVYIPHFRMIFYVYSYASGLLISKSLQGSVKKDPKFIVKVKEFLSAGMSDSPKNIFMKLGVDITKKSFWDKGLDEVEELLKETEKLAKKLKKI